MMLLKNNLLLVVLPGAVGLLAISSSICSAFTTVRPVVRSLTSPTSTSATTTDGSGTTFLRSATFGANHHHHHANNNNFPNSMKNGYRINGESNKRKHKTPPPIVSVNLNNNHVNPLPKQHETATTPTTTTTPAAKKEEEEQVEKERALKFMNVLALNSGFLNGIFLSGVLGKVQAVGPVTDSWTKNALALATGDTSRALFIAQVLTSFSLGAFLNGALLTPNPNLFDLQQRKKPLLVAGLCMMTSALLLLAGKSTTAAVPNAAFFLVCAANGIQNSYSSFATANMCRTSHFTGTTTDLFTILGQCLRGNTTKKERIPIYTGLTVMFWLGGFLGTRWTKSVARATICLALSSTFYLLSSIPTTASFWKRFRPSNYNWRDKEEYAP